MVLQLVAALITNLKSKKYINVLTNLYNKLTSLNNEYLLLQYSRDLSEMTGMRIFLKQEYTMPTRRYLQLHMYM